MGEPGAYLATGMHGGVIYLKHELADADVPSGLVQEPLDADDRAMLRTLLGRYNELFVDELEAPVDTTGAGFFRLRPASSRPYASMYAN